MSISIKELNKQISLISLDIKKNEYDEKVKSTLNDYRKKANIPGFRKGFVPLGLIKKQYEIPVKVDEINKLVQSKLTQFITEKNLSLLGTPIPIDNEKIDWRDDDISLNFEIAKTPEFKLNYKLKKSIVNYKIIADKSMVENQIESIQNQYGKLISLSKIEKHSNLVVIISNDDIDLNKQINISSERLSKKSFDLISKLKIGDSISLDTDKIFKVKGDLEALSGIEKEKIESISKVNFEIKEFNKTEKAKLEKSLFDKIYKENTPKNQTEFKARVKEEIEKQFINQSDQKFLNDVTDELITSLKIDLPEDFIKKLIKINSKDPLTDEDINKEYDNSKKGLKYQLIESKLLEDNDIKIDHSMIKDFTEKSIKNQMIAYGQPQPKKEDLDKISSRILSNEEEVKRMTNQLISEKLISVYKEKINKKVKEITYEKYIELAYKKND
ncbi:MAG: trigger factor [Flavobacteriaceae bacterium]|nr:trigger factor [Flavobacteriaceae bacterium]MBL6684357.1 trigger factor [Flavobacteriaceae bacterium]